MINQKHKTKSLYGKIVVRRRADVGREIFGHSVETNLGYGFQCRLESKVIELVSPVFADAAEEKISHFGEFQRLVYGKWKVKLIQTIE